MIKWFRDGLCLHYQGKMKCWGSAPNWHERPSQKVLSLSVTVKASRLVSHWSNYYDAAPNATVLNSSTIISKGLPGMLSPYHNTFDKCNITVSYAINSERNVCLEQNIHKFASCLHAICIPFLPHFKKSASNNHQKLLISWFYHGNKIFVMEFQNSLHDFLLFTNTVSCHTSKMWELLSTASGNRLEMEASQEHI